MITSEEIKRRLWDDVGYLQENFVNELQKYVGNSAQPFGISRYFDGEWPIICLNSLEK